ncbi:MAG: GxxExxY protein [Candidatus Omnitrophota bacterium]
MDKEFIFKDESYKILAACFEVYNEIGNGFLEAVYQECVKIEFNHQGISFIEKPNLEVEYQRII